jgi:uncharacterized protein
MKIRPPCIVVDTNVLISAGLLPDSKTAQALALAVEHFVIAQNQATWHELEKRIARQKFDRYLGESGRLLHLVKIAQSSEFFEQVAKVSVSRDASDDQFIGLAIDAGASLLMSGDPDLKTVQTYQGIAILSPAEFFERYKG